MLIVYFCQTPKWVLQSYSLQSLDIHAVAMETAKFAQSLIRGTEPYATERRWLFIRVGLDAGYAVNETKIDNRWDSYAD
jgi:hypothetical protein